MLDKNLIVKEAQRYLARGQIDKAIVEWEKLVKEFPDGNAYNTIGDLYLKKGNKKYAVEFFHKSATFFRGEGFSLKSLALYKKIINIDPSDAGSFIALGELSEEKGLITDAIKYYLSAADILAKEASKEKFLNIYERILSLAPSNIPLREKVAGLFLKEGLSSQAMGEYLIIAKLHAEKGDSEEARVYFKKILDIQPDHRDTLVALSEIFEEKDDVQQALAHIKKAVDTHLDDVSLLLRYASLLKKAGAYDEAIETASRALSRNPADTEAHRLMGDIHLAGGNRERGWESYRKVVEYLTQDDIETAIEITREFKDIDPVETGKLLISLYRRKDDIDAVFDETLYVADLLFDSDRREEAIGLYKEALAIRPDDMQLKKILAEQEMKMGVEPSAVPEEKSTEDLLTDADIFIKYGLNDEARLILEELREKEPENTDIRSKLTSLYVEMNDKERAVSECLSLIDIYERNGEAELRGLALQEALKINPDDPRLLEKRFAGTVSEEPAPPGIEEYVEDIAEAEFYLRQGLKEDALRIYHRLSALFPDNDDFQSKVSSLQGGLAESQSGGEEMAPESGGEAGREDFISLETETIEAHEMRDTAEQHLDTDVLDIFEEFKKGIEKELEAEDSETHYNLGIAYKEMGLIDDAIKEFQTSRSDPKCALRSMTMLGICYMDKGLFPLAIEAFKNALDAIGGTRDESHIGAKYDLAYAYEKNGNLKEAFEIFSEIYGLDSKFRQVNERLNHLRSMLPKEETAMKQKEKKDRVSYI